MERGKRRRKVGRNRMIDRYGGIKLIVKEIDREFSESVYIKERVISEGEPLVVRSPSPFWSKTKVSKKNNHKKKKGKRTAVANDIEKITMCLCKKEGRGGRE